MARKAGVSAVATAASPRYEMLDVWRGVACLMVVAHHAAYCLDWADVTGDGPGPWARWLAVYLTRRMSLGVAIFFVISGYCIAASADACRTREEPAGRFIARRFWRIYPPYWVAILVFAAVTVGLDSIGLGRFYQGTRALKLDLPSALSPLQWLGNLTLTETWRPLLGGPSRNVYTAVAWSLCFEEQFYFVCFLALWLAPRRLVGTLTAITAVVLTVRAGAWASGHLPALAGTFPRLWHEFAVGLAVYYRLNLAKARGTRVGIELGLFALFIIGLLTRGRDTSAAAGFGLALVALRRWDVSLANLPWLKPLRVCGRRCYSIYLVHLPFCVVGVLMLTEVGLTGFWTRALVVVPCVSALAVGVGWFYFDLIESRFLNPPAFGAGRSTRSRPSRRGDVSLAGEARA